LDDFAEDDEEEEAEEGEEEGAGRECLETRSITNTEHQEI
jgi:hypothetical protein